MKNLQSKVAVVTGAGSGIGRALALNLAEEGCELALAEINKETLQETVDLLAYKNIKVSSHIVDVADRENYPQFVQAVIAEHGHVDIVINNAGVSHTDTIEDTKYEDFDWIMGINFWAMVYGSKEFLPHLKQRPEAHIVNLSSVFGIIAVPTQATYNATKFGIRGFTEAFRQELRKTSVKVTSVHPGGIRTNIVRNSRTYKGPDGLEIDPDLMAKLFDRITVTTADKAAKTIIKGIKKNKRRVLIGADAKIIAIMQWLMPTRYEDVLGFGMGLSRIGRRFIDLSPKNKHKAQTEDKKAA